MKYLMIYQNNVDPHDNYEKHLNAAVVALNASATYKRNEAEPSHDAERRAIIHAMMKLFPEKTEEDIVMDLVTDSQIAAVAVGDYMYYHHRTFEGNKACLSPSNFLKAREIGLHIVLRFDSELYTGTDIAVENNKLVPQTVISYYNDEKKRWVMFQVADTELYRVTKEFEETCITNGLTFKGGRKSEYDDLMKYIAAYRSLNTLYIPVYEQYDFIGWNKAKTKFISPRKKNFYLNLPNEKDKRTISEGYVLKGNNPAQNVDDILNHIKAHPLAVAIYLCSFINVMIDGDLIDANNMVLDIYGNKGQGKNLLQYVSMNPIGKSEEHSPLMQSWVGASKPGLLASIRIHGSHPVFLEESHMQAIDILQDIGYITFNSASGGKANQDGTSRADKRITSMLVSSGEASILSMVNLDGLTRRVIPLPIRVILEKIIDEPLRLQEWHTKLGYLLKESYGIAIDPFIDYVLENRENIKLLFSNYKIKYSVTEEVPFFDNERYTSYSKYVSCMHVVLDCLLEKFELSNISYDEINSICSKVDSYFRQICSSSHKYLEALEAVISFASKNQEKHFKEGNPNHPQYGKFDNIEINNTLEDCLIFERKELEEFLRSANYIVDNTISSWEQKGVIKSENINKGNGRKAKTTSFRYSLKKNNKAERPYCVVIRLDKANTLIAQMHGDSEISSANDRNNVINVKFNN